jgi:murein DD-endopeptidase MepM/ murein hydrolase activator NlpD
VTLSGSSSGYETSIQELSVVEESHTVSGLIQTSLSSAASSLALPFSVVDEFVDLFSNRVEFRKDLQPGDTFSVTFLTRKNGRTGELLKPGAIASASLKTKGKLLVAVRHADEDGVARYFDERGDPLGNYFLRYPVQFSRISSAFSYARFHPVLKRARPHNGVDFAAPIGTPVRSVADGIVDISGYRGAAGNMIRISHGSRWSTAYLHLNSISSSVRPGARIERGQVIGTVGTTGLSTGPHLHFSLYDRGNYVDPLKTDLPSMQEGVQPLPREYLLAALEALDLEHQRVASLRTMTSAG